MENGESKFDSGILQIKVIELQDGWKEVVNKVVCLEVEFVVVFSVFYEVMDQMKEFRIWFSEVCDFMCIR